MAERLARDFFISYTSVNRPWAEWIAVQLEAAGYTIVLQAWDVRPGGDFLHQMQQATTSHGLAWIGRPTDHQPVRTPT